MVAVPLGQRGLLDRGAGGDPGVGDDDVDAAEGLDRGRNASATAASEVTSPATASPRSPYVGDRFARAVAVEVERDHARAGRRQRLDDRAPDAARAAGDQRDLALQLAGRRRLRELVELQRPVLDRERLRRVQRHELAERLGARHDLDRAVVEVARDLRRLGRRPRGDQAHALDEHDPRVGIAGHVALARVRLEVRAVVGAVSVGELGDPLRRRILARDPQRQALGVHEVVRARRADLHQPRRLLGADELHHALGRVDRQDLRALGRHRTADRRQQRGQRPAGSDFRPPKRDASPVRSLTNSTAWLMTSIVLR